MALTKRTYKISQSIIQDFENLVPSGQRSQAVEALLQESVERQKREALRQNIIEGLEYMADVNEETMREWASTENDGWPEY